jgi:hypothetical protein
MRDARRERASDERCRHHVERYLRDTFGLDEIGLRRVKVILLAHALVDTHLSEEGAFLSLPA